MKTKFRSVNFRTGLSSWPYSEMYAEWLAEAERRRPSELERRLSFGPTRLEEITPAGTYIN